MNKEIWRATVHGVSKSQTQLNELSQTHTFKKLHEIFNTSL